MGRLTNWLRGVDVVEERADPLWWRGGYSSTAQLSSVDNLTAGYVDGPLTVPTVYRCIELISQTIGQFPLFPHRESTGEELERPAVFRRPDPASTYRRFMVDSIVDMLWCGGATWQITARDTAGRAIAMRRVDASLVRWTWNPNRPRHDAIMDGDRVMWIHGTQVTNQNDFVYVPMILRPGVAEGVGPIQALSEQIAGAKAADSMVLSNFNEGVYPSGVVEMDGHLSEAAAERLKKQFIEKNAGTRAPVVMSGGAKYVAVQATAQQQQWTEARGYNTNEIARAFGTPAAMLNIAVMGGSGQVTYNNAVSVRNAFLSNGLSPVMSRLEDAFTIAALPSTQVAHFNTDNYLSPLPQMGGQVGDPNPNADDGDEVPSPQEAAGVDSQAERTNTQVQ